MRGMGNREGSGSTCRFSRSVSDSAARVYCCSVLDRLLLMLLQCYALFLCRGLGCGRFSVIVAHALPVDGRGFALFILFDLPFLFDFEDKTAKNIKLTAKNLALAKPMANAIQDPRSTN